MVSVLNVEVDENLFQSYQKLKNFTTLSPLSSTFQSEITLFLASSDLIQYMKYGVRPP